MDDDIENKDLTTLRKKFLQENQGKNIWVLYTPNYANNINLVPYTDFNPDYIEWVEALAARLLSEKEK